MTPNQQPNRPATEGPAERHARLDAWLDQHHARCLWSRTLSYNRGKEVEVECYRVQAGLVLVLRYADGWDLFTAMDTLDAKATLHDADIRLGIHPATMPADVHVGRTFSVDGPPTMCRLEVPERVVPLTDDEAVGLALALLAASQERP